MPKLLTLVTIVSVLVSFLVPRDLPFAGALLVAVIELCVCWALIALGVLGVLNAICRRKLKAEGVTDEDMADLQRRMLGRTCNTHQEVEKLRRVMNVWGGNKVARPRPREVWVPPNLANVIDFQKWRDHKNGVMEAAE